jgi:hypothetical protein
MAHSRRHRRGLRPAHPSHSNSVNASVRTLSPRSSLDTKQASHRQHWRLSSALARGVSSDSSAKPASPYSRRSGVEFATKPALAAAMLTRLSRLEPRRAGLPVTRCTAPTRGCAPPCTSWGWAMCWASAPTARSAPARGHSDHRAGWPKTVGRKDGTPPSTSRREQSRRALCREIRDMKREIKRGDGVGGDGSGPRRARLGRRRGRLRAA